MKASCLKILAIVLGLTVSQAISAATVVWFDEQEPGTDTYAVRLIVSDRYLRIDDGTDASDYILFDRRDATIYSVNHEEQTIIDIKRVSIASPKPTPMVLAAEPLEMRPGPPINGKQVKLYKLTVNEQKCGEVAAADGLLPDVVNALKQFRFTLAGEQSQVMDAVPKHLRNECDLAESVFASAAHLEHGFPVFHRNYTGRVRSLKTFDESFAASEGLFALPENYRQLSPAQLRSGG